MENESKNFLDRIEEKMDKELGYKNPRKTKETTTTEKQEVVKVDNSAEKMLNAIAIVILIAGLIGTVMCFFNLAIIEYSGGSIFNPSGFAITVGTLLSTLICWGAMNVLTNISTSLKEINSKIK